MSHGIRPDDPTRRDAWDESPAATDVARVSAFWDGGSALHTRAACEVLTAGRSLDCDVRIDHPSVSRTHVRIHGGCPVLIEDLGSSNGTRVGGRRLAPHGTVELRPGELIEVGTAMLIVQGSAVEARAVPIAPAGDDESPIRGTPRTPPVCDN